MKNVPPQLPGLEPIPTDPEYAMTVHSRDGSFVVFCRTRPLREAIADAINDARRTLVLSRSAPLNK